MFCSQKKPYIERNLLSCFVRNGETKRDFLFNLGSTWMQSLRAASGWASPGHGMQLGNQLT